MFESWYCLADSVLAAVGSRIGSNAAAIVGRKVCMKRLRFCVKTVVEPMLNIVPTARAYTLLNAIISHTAREHCFWISRLYEANCRIEEWLWQFRAIILLHFFFFCSPSSLFVLSCENSLQFFFSSRIFQAVTFVAEICWVSSRCLFETRSFPNGLTHSF